MYVTQLNEIENELFSAILDCCYCFVPISIIITIIILKERQRDVNAINNTIQHCVHQLTVKRFKHTRL